MLQNVWPSSYSLSDEVTYFLLPKQQSTGDGKGRMPLRPPLFSCLRLSFLSEHAFAIFGFPIFREHCRSCRACFANIKVKAMFQGLGNAFWTLLVVSGFRGFPVLLACFSISRQFFFSFVDILKDARKEFANKVVSVQRLGRWDRRASLFRPYLPYRQSGTMAAAFWERSYHCSVQVGEIYILACTILLLCTWSSLKVITTGNLGCFRIRLPFCASKLAPEIKKIIVNKQKQNTSFNP